MMFLSSEFSKKNEKAIDQPEEGIATREIIEKIISDENLDEKCLWEKMNLHKAVMRALEDKYVKINNCRNKVMHAKNLDEDTFNEIKRLLSTVNSELEEVLELITADTNEVDILRNAKVGENISDVIKKDRGSGRKGDTI